MYWRAGGSKNKSILIINKKRFNYVMSADCWCIVLGASIGRIAEWTEEKRNMIMYSRITYLEHNLCKWIEGRSVGLGIIFSCIKMKFICSGIKWFPGEKSLCPAILICTLLMNLHPCWIISWSSSHAIEVNLYIIRRFACTSIQYMGGKGIRVTSGHRTLCNSLIKILWKIHTQPAKRRFLCRLCTCIFIPI